MIKFHSDKAPLRKPVETSEVGDTALYLVSQLSRGVTGEILYVDAGFQSVGISPYFANEN